MLPVTSGDDDAVRPRLIGESTARLTVQAEHIAGDADSRTGRNAAVPYQKHQIDRSQSGDEIKRYPDCVIEVVGDEHDLVSMSSTATCVSRRDIEGCGLEGLDDLGDLGRRRPLADPREARESAKPTAPRSSPSTTDQPLAIAASRCRLQT